jgi:ABC-type Zn uptake system ZnuABC Zn-binding protein ZnuA
MRRAATASITVLALLASQACSRPPEADVIAADGALCDITRRLAADDLRVSCLLGPGDDPHQLQLTPQQTRQLRQARLVLINGYELTPALQDLPSAVKVAERAVPNSPEIATGHAAEEIDHQHGQHIDSHQHGDRDPHVWHDPRQATAMTNLVSQQLAALAPKATGRIEARAAAMRRSLVALDRWNQQQFSTLPQPRTLASGHRAFASLARAYQLQELPLIDATSSSETLRPNALAKLIARLREQRVRSLFAEQAPASRSLERISALSGIPVAKQPLRADAGGDNLMTTLTSNTCLIVDGLGGRCDQRGAQALIRGWDAIP